MKPEPLYYIPVRENDHEVAGPYDLVQMARLLRTGVIQAETLTFREGEADWQPFGNRPQFIIAKEMPPDAVSNRLVMLKEQEEAAKHGAIPIPSAETMIKIGGAALLLLIGGIISYFVAAADVTTGILIAVLSGGAALVGMAFIVAHLIDEPWIVRLMVLFVPLFDVYYFTSNLDKYLPYLIAKYAGAVISAAALAGMASVDARQAGEVQSILSLFRL